MGVLRQRCVDGIAADAARARELLDRSTAAATALSPYIGYAATAKIAKESVKTGRPIREPCSNADCWTRSSSTRFCRSKR